MLRFALALVALCSIAAAPSNITVTPLKSSPTLIDYNPVHDLNEYRRVCGLAPVTEDAELTRYAQGYAEWMASNKVFTHSPVAMNAYSGIGEDIARGETGSKEVIHDWSTSPGHARTMRGAYTKCGFGVAKDSNNVWYWVLQLSR